ncbi:MAG: hypothetical protein HY330_04275, partial [Chloroflexi bacterium]|nr:hypothetical protein [Chloroflexota bacterium]
MEGTRIPIPGARKIDGYLNPMQEDQGLELLEDEGYIFLVRYRQTDEGTIVPRELARQPKATGGRE